MPTLECVCGYSCGSAKAWQRHIARFADDASATHQLVDPSLLPHTEKVEKDEMETGLVTASKGRTFTLDESKLQKSLQHESMPLISAARHGDLARLNGLLADPLSADGWLDRCDAAGMSAIAWAAKTGRCEVIGALLAARASPNLAPPRARAVDASVTDSLADAHPPLYLALTKGRYDAASMLLDAGALASEPEPVRGQTALHAACSTAVPIELLERLLDALQRHAADEEEVYASSRLPLPHDPSL